MSSAVLRTAVRSPLCTTWFPAIRTTTTFSHPILRSLLRISDEVSEALATNKPLVALESTIYTHGALKKGLAELLERIVRDNGAVPATIGVLNGKPTVGLMPEEIEEMIAVGGAAKVSRRDMSVLTGLGLTGKKLNGGTTIAGTMILSRLAGIRIFGTGGLGGVHRNGENTLDISADLTELGRTRVAVVSSGCKGFLDIPRTLEFLETQGVTVATFADGREGKVDFPAFWARDSGVKSPAVVQTEQEAAGMIYAQEVLRIESGLLFGNPIEEKYEVPREKMRDVIETALREADEKGFTGSQNTPYVLGRIKELTGNKSVTANLRLVEGNVARAAKIAVELAKLEKEGVEVPVKSQAKSIVPDSYSNVAKSSVITTDTTAPLDESGSGADILVAGSVALDLSCDYTGGFSNEEESIPQLHTSNPSAISQSIGGVGHNVALAAHLVSAKTNVRLCSLIGDDVAGSTVLNSLRSSGLDTTYIRCLGPEYLAANRTAQYVAINTSTRSLHLAMADMAIFTHHSFPEYWASAVAGANPDFVVVDGNWSEKDIKAWIHAAKKGNKDTKVAFEPVSTVKSMRVFGKGNDLGLWPRQSIDLASPNDFELSSMFTAAKENGFLDDMKWFSVLDSFNIRGGARDSFVRVTNQPITDAGIPQQTINLLPYIPTILTKLGPNGVLLTEILKSDDPRLRSEEHFKYVISRAKSENSGIGGVYMRLYPAAEKVEHIVSVNGAGDTFLGVIVAGLAMGGKVGDLISVAQKGAVMTLKCRESVSLDLDHLDKELREAVAKSMGN